MTPEITYSAGNSYRRTVIAMLFCIAAICLSSSAHAFSPPRDTKVFETKLQLNNVDSGIMQFFSRPNGNSGYYQIENTTSQDLKYRVRITMKDGKSKTRVVHAEAGSLSPASSFSAAGSNRVGIDRVELLYTKPE